MMHLPFYSTIILALLSVLFVIMDYLLPLDIQKIDKQLSTRIYDKDHKLLRIKLSKDGYWRFKATGTEIPERLKKSVLSFEDRYFYHHFGVNPIAILRALWMNAHNRRTVGASTITMQVARMMYHRDRTVVNKLIEMFNAMQLEWHYSKDEILTIYFNLAPYGGNIEGVETAAWFYFKKPLNELSISEIAILTTIPKNPNANRPDRQAALTEKRDRVLHTLLDSDVITKDQLKRAGKETIVAHRERIPMLAPHFTERFTTAGEITTTLDYALQSAVEKKLVSSVKNLQNRDVHNGAVIVIHNPTMQVQAYVGSNDFYDRTYFGQNDGIRMIRSPGSVLKPFIYAKAFDQGIATPRQKLFDLPLHLNGYTPKNFNKRFFGVISVEEALQKSLNIPAIELNRLLEDKSLYEMLKLANVDSVTMPKSYYGDAIAIGGLGVSLEDIAKLYASFSNEGQLRSLVYSDVMNSTVEAKLFSGAAGYLTSTILSDGLRPEFSSYWESTEDKPRIAFKTGTSASSRDLLTVAYTPEYTVAVWMGNFDGSSTQDLTGINTASHVAFSVFDYLQSRQVLQWFEQPSSIIEQTHCTDAIRVGRCKNSEKDLWIKDVLPQRPCRLLRAEVLAFLIESREIDSIVSLSDNRCYAEWKAYPPLLASLYEGSEVTFNGVLPDEMKKMPLLCYSYQADPQIHWIIDQKIVKGESGKMKFITLPTGTHEIGCVDAASSLSTVNITLKEI